MERLTDKKSGNPICSEQGGLGVSAKFIRRLAEYENTELAPDEISILKEENAKLKQKIDEAMELLKMADNDLWRVSDCKVCIVECICDIGSKKKCLAGCGKFKCSYSDRYEKLKGEVQNERDV